MKRRLEQFYAAFGDKGVMFILFALALVINTLMTVSRELPAVFPEEITAAGFAAFYSRKAWQGLMAQVCAGEGYIAPLLYAPIFFVFKSPYAIYKAMLIINAILISFVPLIAYHLSAKLGVVRVRSKLLCALCSGLSATYLSSSKFIGDGTLCCLMTWILVWIMFVAWDKKNRYTRFTASLAAGFLSAAAYGASTRLLAAVLAVAFTALFARLFFKEKILNLPAFGISLAASFTAEHFLRVLVLEGAAEGVGEPNISTLHTGGALSRIFGGVYAFMTQSLGMGALAAAIMAAILFSWIREGIKNKERVLENGTRVYEPTKHRYNIRITVFGLFQMFMVFFTAILFSLFSPRGEAHILSFEGLCEIYESAAGLSLFFVLVFIINHGIDLLKLIGGAGIYGYACLSFGIICYPELEKGQGGAFATLPFRMGENTCEPFGGMSFVIMSSCVFSLFVLLIVLVSCSRKHLPQFIAFVMYCLTIHSGLYMELKYLPETAEYYSAKSEPYKKAAEIFYNNAQSPPIVTYETEPDLAAALQFLEYDVKVSMLKKGEKVPESCLLVAKNGVAAPFEGGSYDIVGKTPDYTVYAYGESARSFMKYSAENEQRSGTIT